MQSARRALQLTSDSISARVALQTVLYFSGRYEEGVEAGRVSLALCGRHPLAMASQALTLADWGKNAEAEAIYAEMMARARCEYVQPSLRALSAAAATQWDEALRHACEAVSIGDPGRSVLSSHWLYGRRLRHDSRIDQMPKKNGIA